MNGLLYPSTAGDNIFGNNKGFARCDGETTAQDKAARTILLDKDVLLAEMARHFLTHDDSSDGRRNYRRGGKVFKFLGQQSADMRGHRGILQQQRALEELAAVQARSKNKVTLQEGARLAEEVENVAHERLEEYGVFWMKRGRAVNSQQNG